MDDAILHRILAELGELRGDVKGLIAAHARLDGRIDEHLEADERAHGRQDERIAELMAKLGRIEAGHEASLRAAIIISAVLGVIAGGLGEIVLRALGHG